MAKNQKRAAVELRWQRLVVVMGLVGFIGSLTVGYVAQRRAHDALGQQIESIEREIGWVSERVREARDQLERSRRKEVLVGRVQAMDLGLRDVTASQRLVIPLITEPTGPVRQNSPAAPGTVPSATMVAATDLPASTTRR
jgi:hypothetical protein